MPRAGEDKVAGIVQSPEMAKKTRVCIDIHCMHVLARLQIH